VSRVRRAAGGRDRREPYWDPSVTYPHQTIVIAWMAALPRRRARWPPRRRPRGRPLRRTPESRGERESAAGKHRHRRLRSRDRPRAHERAADGTSPRSTSLRGRA